MLADANADAKLDANVDSGVWVLGGLGARGFTLAPLLGEILAAEIMQRPAPLPRDQRLGVGPARYAAIAQGRRD